MSSSKLNPAQSSPLVGIALATFNPRFEFFVDQIASLKNQTCKNWKCIIVDDNSSEANFAEIKNLVGDDPRFEVHRNHSNGGSFKTFERALTLLPSAVEFVCFCDQDDIWIPTKLELQLAAFNDESIQLVHTDQSLIDDKSRVFVASCWHLEGRSILEASTDLLLFRNLITGCTTMFRRKVLETALPFYPVRAKPEMYHHDMWVAMHACVHGRVVGMKEPLVLYRQHGNNLVGVSTLRARVGPWKLASRAYHAYRERCGLRSDFWDSLDRFKNGEGREQFQLLAYLDSPVGLFLKGFKFVTSHPQFFRVWLMLGVGLLGCFYKKNKIPNEQKVF